MAGAVTVGKLIIDIGADTAQIKTDMASVSAIVSEAATVIDDAATEAKKALIGLAASLAPLELAHLIADSIEAADNLQLLSVATNISASNLSGLQLVATMSGTNLQSAAMGIERLSKNIGANAEAFQQIGITARDPLEAFEQLSDLFNSIEDPMLRNAVMTKALGKSWQDLAPVLAMGSEKIGELMDTGKNLSGLTDEQAAAAHEFSDTLDELKAAGSGVVTQIGADLTPTLTFLAETFLDTTKNTKDAVSSFDPFKTTLEGVAIVAGTFYNTWHDVGIVLAAVAAQIDALVHGNLAGYAAIQDQAKADLEASDAAFLKWKDDLVNASANANAKILQNDKDYEAAALAVQQAYINSSLKIQQQAQIDVSKAFGGTPGAVGGPSDQELQNFTKKNNALQQEYQAAMQQSKQYYALEESARAIYNEETNAEYQRALVDASGYFDRTHELEVAHLQDVYLTNAAQIVAQTEMDEADLASAIKYNQKPAIIAAANAKIIEDQNKMVLATNTYNNALLASDQKYLVAKQDESQKYLEDMVAETAAYVDQATTMQQANQQIGMTTEQIAALQAQRDQDTISVLQNEQATIAATEAKTEEGPVLDNLRVQYALLGAQIDALNGVIDATLAKPMLEEWNAEIQQFSADFKKGFEDMVNNGLGTWHKFTQSLVTTFKTEVADEIYKLFMQPFVVNLVASVIGVSASGAANAAGLAGTGANAASMLSSIGNWVGSDGISVGSSQLIAQAGSTAYQMGAQDAGTWLMQNASSIGNDLNFAGSAFSYMNAFTDVLHGQVLQGIGTAIGTYFGGPIGGWIGSEIGSLVSNALGIGGGETRSGGSYAANIGGTGATYVRGPSGGNIGGAAGGTAVENMTGALPVSIDQMLKLLGSSATVTGYEGGLEESTEGKGGTYGGGTLSTGAAFGNTNATRQFNESLTGAQALTQYGNQLGTNFIQGLQAADISGPAGEYLAALGALKVPLASDTAGTAELNKELGFISGTLVLVQAAAQKQPAMWSAIMSSLTDFQASGESVTDTATRMAAAFVALQPAVAQVQLSTAQAWGPDTVAMVTAAGATIQETTWQTWNDQSTAVEGLISTFDGSVTATNALATATQARYQTEQALVNDLATAMGTISESFKAANQSMATSLMTADQQVAYYTAQANAQEQLIMAETDPTKLQAEAQQFLTDQQNAWNQMTTAQQQQVQSQWTAENTTLSDYLTNAIGTSLSQINTTSGQTLPDQVTAAITSAMASISAAQQAAASAQQTAADAQQAAANTQQSAANAALSAFQKGIAVSVTSTVPLSQLSVVG